MTDGVTAAAHPSVAAAAPTVHHVEVPRTARYYTVGDAASAHAVWVALHGYGQLAEYFVRHFVPHAAGRLVIAPEALSRFYLPRADGAVGGGGRAATAAPSRVGATWMTREDRLTEIGDYVRYLDRAFDAATPDVDLARAPLHVLGFSQGAATACRWLAHRHRLGRAPAAHVVLWGGTLPGDFDLAGTDGDALRASRLTLVLGVADDLATADVIADEEARLRIAGIAYVLARYPGGHRLDGDTLGRVMAG